MLDLSRIPCDHYKQTQGMLGRRQPGAQPPLRRLLYRTQPGGPQLFQATDKLGPPTHRVSAGSPAAAWRTRLRRRQLQTQLRGQLRQGLAG